MSKLNDKIIKFKLEYPKLTKAVNNEILELTADEYEATIQSWAEVEIAAEDAKAEAAAKKAAAEAKLAALGLTADDLKALGLGGN